MATARRCGSLPSVDAALPGPDASPMSDAETNRLTSFSHGAG